MLNQFATTIIHKHKACPARITKVITPHGEFLTPAFMPVGTRAFVNHINPHDLEATGSQIILGGNTYHMLCSPGMETIQALGGMHKFMGWHKPMLTDSGGYQVFSLSKNSKICIIDENGARFKHPDTGKMIYMNSQSSIEAQKIIGADIIMAFDQCTPDDGNKAHTLAAMERTHRWLLASKELHDKNPYSTYGLKQALFGIVQGGSFRDLREQSAEFITQLDMEGIALGGEVIGFDIPKTCEIIDWVIPIIPENKTRYVMGVGLNPQDLIDTTARGVDIFDCVGPTRNARHGSLYCGKIVEENNWLRFVGEGDDKSRILIKKSMYVHDEKPIMENCDCYTCRNFTRAYLHYLFKIKSLSYGYLASIHNIRVMQKVCEKIREVILKNTK